MSRLNLVRLLPPARFVGPIALVVSLLWLVAPASGDWRLALPGWRYTFDDDHFPHADFKTEWWYFTGNLRADDGRRFGYQLTFFRQGILPPGQRRDKSERSTGETASDVVAALSEPPRAPDGPSRFVVNDLKFAHFALTDVAGKQFHYRQKLSRGAFGEAGFAPTAPEAGGRRIAWIDEWRLSLDDAGRMLISGGDGKVSVALQLGSGKPWTIHGEGGVSQKAAGVGRASHYYSGTRLPSAGRVTLDGREYVVEGESWFDHEWASNQLTPEQVGWDWFSMQLGDGTELMLYQMRTRGRRADPNSSGTFISARGATQHLRQGDYTLTPEKFWTSKATGARYPIAWKVAVPSIGLQLTVTTPVEDQELVLQPIAYWEGLIDVAGERDGRAIRGHGYLELTGYAGELVGLASPQ